MTHILRTIVTVLTVLTVADAYSQSAIYACGHIRRNRSTAITNLRNSGYTTAILFNVNVEEDGSLTTDFTWSTQTAAEAGGIICQDGEYVFDEWQPNYIEDIQSLLEEPTSINRLELCIGGWGNGSYGNIKTLIDTYGTGEETTLYRNFKALKEALPEIVAVNNDQEQDYDTDAAVAFHRMMYDIGYVTTVAPYTKQAFWKEVVAELNETPGTVDIIYLQTYGGGASNNPSSWAKLFDGVPMYVGFDCESSSDIDTMESNFEDWRDNSGAVGGFLWNYNSEDRDVNEWATAINRIFSTKTTDSPVATFYEDIYYDGYSVALPEGEFTQAEMALYGLKAQDVSSFTVEDGYSVTLYRGKYLNSGNKTFTESTSWVGSVWNDAASSILIEKTSDDTAINAVESGNDSGTVISIGDDGCCVSVSGDACETEIYTLDGQRVASATSTGQGTLCIDTAGLARGVYIVRAGGQTAKFVRK